jgi:hypothetical protein
MRVSKGAIARASSADKVPAQPYVRRGSNRNGNENSALDHAERMRQCTRGPRRDADTTVQAAPNQPVRSPRNRRGLQPFACI